ncbi:ATP-dependent Clp protease proteolytic subunit 3 [Hibiscus syriacus]|uniref:ATP-dependent Clp protease proteolytic subunit 3 n=1 Tax=Hibiscus syriacus TaxID=106335 RepID=A0A6A2XEC0_HIBSY|nr:ATP-dependent Clp protease proteolytic subunit 3 [Hibiscus syriacus]
MAKLSMWIEEDGEGPSNRVPKRQRVERVFDIGGSGQEESEEDEESGGEEASEREDKASEGKNLKEKNNWRRNRCPSCSTPIGYSRCREIEKVLESVKVSCQNTKYGCKEAFSYSLKQKHEKACPFVPCSCPLPKCYFEGSSEDLSAHFGNVHKYSATCFLYDRLTTITFGVSEKSLILREETDGSLFILHNKVETLGNVITLSRIGPITERGFFYELIVKSHADGSTLRLQSFTKSTPKRVDNPQSLGFLLVPSQFSQSLGFLLVPSQLFSSSFRQIKMDLRVWCSDRISCYQRPSGA